MDPAVQDFESLSQFVAAVVGVERTGEADKRLRIVAAALGVNEVGGPAGGYLAPAAVATEIWARVYSSAEILSRCDRMPAPQSGKLSIPGVAETDRAANGSRFGGAQMAWGDEAAAIDSSKLQLEMINLTLKKLVGLIYSTDEALDDANTLAAAIKRIFALEAVYEIEKAIVRGDGIAKPLGILKSEALIVVAKDGSQGAGSVSATNLSGMTKALWGPSHQNAVWLMGNDIYGKICDLQDEDGLGLFEVGPNGERMLYQMPVLLSEYASPAGEEGDIILADFSQYIVLEKEGQLLSSLHFKFVTDESSFKVRYRVDGAPGWSTSVTPDNSNNKQSPFVALGVRD